MIRQCALGVALIGVSLPACVPSHPATPPTPRVTIAQLFNPSGYSSLGIYLENLSGNYVQDGVLRLVEDEFMRSILQRGYVLAARSDIDRVLREQRLQSSGVTEEAIARVGRALNVPAIIIVSVNSISTSQRRPPALYNPSATYYRTTIAVSARLVGAERAEVLWISSFTDDWDSDSSGGDRRDIEARALQYVASIVANGLPFRRGTP